jgi:hypothetical protein
VPEIRAFIYITLSLCAILAARDASAAPSANFFPLKDVRPGLKGIGKTVFSGTRVEEFQVEVLGVLENAGPRQAIILARLSGGPIERTGVMQGMSGSPVYIDGKLLGAVAMAFPFSKEPIAGIRPISEMVAPEDATAERRQQARVKLTDKSVIRPLSPLEVARSVSDTNPVEIATPVSFSGFTPATIEHFAPQLRAIGLEPRQGMSGGQSTNAVGGGPLEPGSMISVQLVSGDLNMGADGTVTHVDGNRVYAFGHRFLSLGATELPFTRASVIALLPNISTSFKISASGEWLGSVTSDLSSAISGELGRRPRMVPVSITVNGGGKRMQYRMTMVQDRLLSPLLVQMLVYSTIDATERTLGSGTVALRGRVQMEDLSEPLVLDNMFAGDFNVPMQAALSTAMPVAYALQNSLEPLRLKSIDLTLDAFAEKKQMTVEQIWSSRREVRPGETVQLNVLLSTDNGREITNTVNYDVPVGAPLGPLYFTAADGVTINAAEQRYLTMTQPQPADRMVSFLNSMHGSNKAMVRVWRSDPAYNIDGQDLPDPPPSLAMILARGASAAGTQGRTSTVARLGFADGTSVVSGSKTIQVDIIE